MGSFFTRHDCKVDAKGRLALPAKLKGAIPESEGNTLMLRNGDDGCLALYTQTEFKKLLHKVNSLSDRDKVNRTIKRIFFESITDVELDAAGRFLIPKPFLERVGIKKDALVLGVGSYIEIWNPEIYKKETDPFKENLTGLLDEKMS